MKDHIWNAVISVVVTAFIIYSVNNNRNTALAIESLTADRNLILQKIEIYNQTTCATLEGMEYEVDSINNKLGKLAEASLYLDSCQQAKGQKADRAERRGRFVGGLLKGLLPHF